MLIASIYYIFFQAEDGIRDLVRSRGLGDVYKRQLQESKSVEERKKYPDWIFKTINSVAGEWTKKNCICLLYTSDAADERSSVDLGGRRIIKKKNRWE